MVSYDYKAYGPAGDLIEGSIEAGSRQQALKAIHRLGCKPFQVTLGSETGKRFWRPDFKASFMPGMDHGRLFADLDVLLTASFTIDRAIHTLLSEPRASHERKALEAVHQRLTSGQPLAASFAAMDGLSSDVLALLESAEGSGRIGSVVASLAQSYREAAKNRGLVLQAVSYPLFLLCAMIGAFLVILFSLVPAIAPVFENTAATGNNVVSTLILLHGAIFSHLDLLIAATASTIAAGAWLLLAPRGRKILLNSALRLPLVGGLIADSANARYLETLATLLHNGVSMRKALQLAVDVSPVPAFRTRLEEISNHVVSGGSFKQAAALAKLFDATTLALIAVGDDASRLPQALERAANLLLTRSKQKMERALALLAPVMTVTMGVMIGGLVLSIMSALIGINDMALQ